MLTQLSKRACVITLCLSILVCFLVVWWLVQPQWLTRMYDTELRTAIQRYLEDTATVEGQRDPKVIAQVTTGRHRDYLTQVRCIECPAVQVATKTSIKSLEVLEYSSTLSKVRVRVEYGWHMVEPNTNAMIGPCHAQAYTTILILAKEGALWKVSDVEDISQPEANRIDDSPGLLAKYCSD